MPCRSLRLASGDADGHVYLWDAVTAGQTAILADPGGQAVWAAATGHLVATVADPAGKAVDSVAFSPDGEALLAGDRNGSAYLWNISAQPTPAVPAAVLSDPGCQTVSSVAFSRDGEMAATGCGNNSAYLWHVS